MEEIILQEKKEVYCNKTVYCYVEKQKDALDSFISKYDNESVIHIISPVVDSCEGNLPYCLYDIITNYMEFSKKACTGILFVTDIKSLYNITRKLLSALFEEIIYIEQDNKKEFNDGFKIKDLINYFLNIQKEELHSSLAMELYNFKNNTDFDVFIKYLFKLEDAKIENNEKMAKLWSCFIQFILYEIEQNGPEEKYFYYKLVLYSILMRIGKSVYYVNLYLNEILGNNKINNRNRYFIYHQFKRLLFTKEIVSNKETRILIDKLYDLCYEEFSNELKDYTIKIPSVERNKNLVMVMTVQFLGKEHAPTQTIIERIKILKSLGKSVVLVNTTELCHIDGCLPLYCMKFANVFKEYNELNEIKIGEYRIPFLQIPEDLPIQYRMKVLDHIINKIKPYYILSIGNGSILADLCGNIVPCASMGLVFSTFPKTKNKMKILGRKLNESEKENYKDDDIIESRFTFELKPQKEHYLRENKNLPVNKFILAVVGTRLHFDVTDDFMEMLQKVCGEGCYVVFAGIMDNYNILMEKYPVVSVNSSFTGYCDDILALMEVCDLYVNPDRLGGGFSVIEAFSKGIPGVYLKSGDVYTAGGEDFAVNDFDEMAKQILRYKDDKDYYNKMSELAKERAKLMTSSKEAIADIDRQICQRIEEKYW